MGKIVFASWRKLLFFLLLLLLTAVFVHFHKRMQAEPFSGPPLAEALTEVGKWVPGNPYPLSPILKESLSLDDYLWRPYRNQEKAVELYVGFYHTARKIGAAHDPLVCFSGQGWILGRKETGEMSFGSGNSLRVAYATMVAEREERREFLLYWFQSHDHSSPGTFAQKLAMIRSRFLNQGQANAFVRINVRFDGGEIASARKAALDFLADFYPLFHRYVTEN